MKLINAQGLKRQYDLLGPARTVQHLTEHLEEKKIKPDDFSIRDCFVALIEGGDELLNRISYRKSGRMSFLEAAQAVDTSAFSNIIGQIIYSRIKERYNDPAFLWPELCETIPTEFLDGEK